MVIASSAGRLGLVRRSTQAVSLAVVGPEIMLRRAKNVEEERKCPPELAVLFSCPIPSCFPVLVASPAPLSYNPVLNASIPLPSYTVSVAVVVYLA